VFNVRIFLLSVFLLSSYSIAGLPTLSPSALVISRDGKTVYVAEANAGQVVRIDLATGRIQQITPVPGSPSGIALSSDERHLFATIGEATGRVVRLSLEDGHVDVFPAAGHTLMSPVLSHDNKMLYVCSRFQNAVLALDAATGRIIRRSAVLREPVAAVLTSTGNVLFVANHLPEGPSTGAVVAAAITVLDVTSGEVVSHIRLPNGSTALRDMCMSPDGAFLYVPHALSRFQSPTTQLERGWMTTSALSIIDTRQATLINTVLLDDFDMGAANPWGVACSPDGELLLVSHSGTHEISIIRRRELHDRLEKIGRWEPVSAFARKSADVPGDLTFLAGIRVRVRLPGNGPRKLAVAGQTAIIAEYFSDTLAAVSIQAPTSPPRTIRLGPPGPMSRERRGEMLFHDATLCYQQWQSCATCHPDARADGLNWDLLNDGLGNPKNTKSLVLSHVTPPAMVSAIRETAEMAVRSGFRFIQFHAVPEKDASDVDVYLKGLLPVPSPFLRDGLLSEKAQRGEEVFREAGCAQCHPPPLFTDMKKYDIGLAPSSARTNLFDTSTIIENWRTAPYLYDGRAAAMGDVLRKHNKGDKHGKTSALSTNDLDALVEYLMSL